MSINYLSMAEKAKLMRESLGLTLPEVAERAGVSRSTVCRIEAGDGGTVSFDRLQRVMSVLDWRFELERGQVTKAHPDKPSDEAIEAHLASLFGDKR